MDTALKSIARSAKIGTRHADKLVKVFLLNGDECWLLIHIEVQTQFVDLFATRMAIYHFRAFELYRKDVYSIAILADENPEWRPGQYRHARWDCELKLSYPVIKLHDFRRRADELFNSKNPFAHVILAFLKTQDTMRDEQARKNWKFELTKNLYRRGFDKSKIQSLYRVIDWFMSLSDNVAKEFDTELTKFEEELEMPYVTSIERHGIEKGIEQGKLIGVREVVIDILRERFGRVPKSLASRIEGLDDMTALAKLLRWASTTESIKNFPLDMN